MSVVDTSQLPYWEQFEYGPVQSLGAVTAKGGAAPDPSFSAPAATMTFAALRAAISAQSHCSHPALF
jgi:hypothetical protein